MKRIIAVLIIFSCFLPLHTKKITAFSHLVDPRYMVVDDGRIIISDYPYIYLYSLDDFSLQKKIGGAGEGPGEFYIQKENMNLKERGLVISVRSDYLAASSSGRISFFKPNGDFHKLTKILHTNINAKFLYDHEKLLGFIPRKGQLTVSLFDWNLENPKKIFECGYWLNWSRKKTANFFDRSGDTLLVGILDHKIFMTRGDSPRLAIDVYDFNGKKLHTIKHNTGKIEIPKGFVDRIHKHFRFKYRHKDYNYFINNLNLPKYFPPVRNLCLKDNMLYLITFAATKGKTRVLVFTTGGRFLREILLPVKERNPEQLFPFSVSKDKFYQIIEDKETDNWELFVTSFK